MVKKSIQPNSINSSLCIISALSSQNPPPRISTSTEYTDRKRTTDRSTSRQSNPYDDYGQTIIKKKTIDVSGKKENLDSNLGVKQIRTHVKREES